MEAETVFVLAIFSVFVVVGASLFFYACCVTDNDDAVKKLRESLKRKRNSIKLSVTNASQFPHSLSTTQLTSMSSKDSLSVGIQVTPPTPEVFQPPPEFSEGSSTSLTPIRTPTPDPLTEHRGSIDCSNHSNVLSVLLSEYLTSLAKVTSSSTSQAGSKASSIVDGNASTTSDSPRVVIHL